MLAPFSRLWYAEVDIGANSFCSNCPPFGQVSPTRPRRRYYRFVPKPRAGSAGVVGVASKGMLRIKALDEFLQAEPVLVSSDNAAGCDYIAGWGRKPTSQAARKIARKARKPFVTLEDGFLRSLGLGDQDPPLSIVVDATGIYYDADFPSDLERTIPVPLTTFEFNRATTLIESWRHSGVSKYNHAPDFDGELPSRYVLVIDQTFNDHSVTGGLANVKSFQFMLRAALREYEDCEVIVKVHPDVWAGRKLGYFSPQTLESNSRLRVLSVDCHPAPLLKNAQAVYTVTSQVGFEALIFGRPVRCFGMPFYAGWGLTVDGAGVAVGTQAERKSKTGSPCRTREVPTIRRPTDGSTVRCGRCAHLSWHAPAWQRNRLIPVATTRPTNMIASNCQIPVPGYDVTPMEAPHTGGVRYFQRMQRARQPISACVFWTDTHSIQFRQNTSYVTILG